MCALVVMTTQGSPVKFDVPAQPAASALMAFSQQAGVDVLFASADTKNLRTTAVVGIYEPAEAIALMLDGTGLSAKPTSSGKFVVRRERTPPPTTVPKSSEPTAPQEKDGPSTSALPEKAEVIRLAAFVVTPSQFGIGDDRIARNVTLTSAELQPLPQIGEDLYRTVTRLPGLSTNERSAMFMVRGAPNREVLSRFDGVDLIEPFHLKDYDGALSIIDLETVGSVNLITGGFTADYGDRLAGVFTIETQANPEPGLHTTLGLSVTNLRATNQGTFADGDGQWLVTARRGYIDLALKLGGNDIKDSPSYYDVSGKVLYRLSPNQTLSLHVLHAGDTFESLHNDPDPDLRSSYDSTFLWGRWLGNFGDRVSSEAVVSFSQLDWHRQGDGQHDEVDSYVTHPFTLRDDRRLNVLGLRNDWTINLTAHALIRTGFEFKAAKARYDYAMSRVRYSFSNGNLGTATLAIDAYRRPYGEHTGAYIAPRFQPWTPLIIEPSVRFDRDTQTGESVWSPRLNASYTMGRTAVRAAWGIYQQAQGVHELAVGDGETTFHSPERAEQRVIGISHQLKSGTELRLEAYERLTTHQRPYWINLTEPYNLFPESLYDRVQFSPTRGRARGVELFVQHRDRGRFGWGASYAYAVNEDEIGGRWMPRYWDQRHTLYMDVTYVPARNWQLSAAWQFHTGWPYTDQIFYLQRLNNGGMVANWYYGQTNALRAPAYHRLDLRATRTYRFEKGTLRVFVDIWNAYDRKNSAGFDNHYGYIANGQLVVVKTPGKLLSILPSAGLSWEF